ncbi:hypothetical protein KUCAC02_003666, partial [Chaenocephalus aceratus]
MILQSFHELKGRGKPRRRREPRSVWVRKWLSEKRRERYGHYSTLLNELKTEDEKAFFNYTRLPRGLYDEVLRRVEGRIEKKDTWYRKSLPPGLKLSITLRHLASGSIPLFNLSLQSTLSVFAEPLNGFSLIDRDEFGELEHGWRCPGNGLLSPASCLYYT